jgi:anti-sigma factor RsiW
MGGRLLPAGTGTGAQFMYEDRAGSRLTLYVRTGESDATAFRFRREGDIATFSWIDDGLGFALTASKDREQLLPVAEAVYRQIDLPAPARAP